MRDIGDPFVESHAPRPGGDGGGARSSSSDHFVIVNLPENFDINQAFESEQDLESATSKPAAGRLGDPDPSDGRAKQPSLSIADLLDNHVRLEWHEAVAIAQHLCHVMVRDPAANVHHSLVEPWNVEITNSGDIRVLPGGSSSDPIVKQVGRVLRALLLDSIAPAELRLVASQASFEVPVYSSVEELSAALRHFERPGELDAIRAAFQRGLEAKYSVAPVPTRGAAPAAAALPPAGDQSWTVKATPEPLAQRPPPRRRGVPRPALAAAGVILLIASALVIRLLTSASERTADVSTPGPAGHEVGTRPSAPPERREIAEKATSPPVTLSPLQTPPNSVVPVVSSRALRPLAGRAAASVPATATPSARATAPTRRPLASSASDSLEAERRAAGLLASGRADEAAIVFDAIVMRNPFYQLDPARSSAEALSAFRSSKSVLLPALARRQYQEARSAFDAGDFSRSIASGGRAQALLNSLDNAAAPSDLNEEITNLVALATAARTAEEETVYSIVDPGVTPPRPVGRQLATAAQSRKAVKPTGRLEILVGRSGRVETVRLETPLNGYHDRMIMSAVKAWRYKPALRNGKPVRFNLVMSITLPDS